MAVHSKKTSEVCVHTEKKENQVFLIYKKIQTGAVAKSYMQKGFLIYEKMRKKLVIYEEAVSHIFLCNRSLLLYEEKLVFFFISAVYGSFCKCQVTEGMKDVVVKVHV